MVWVRLARRGDEEVACLVGWGHDGRDARGWGSCVGHGGMLAIFILGDREAIGTLRSGGAVGTVTLGGRAWRPDQRVIGGIVEGPGLGAGRSNCMIFDNCISACVCSFQNFAVGEAGCGCLRAAMSSCIERVMFSCGERPGRTWSWGKKRTVSPYKTQRVSGHQMSKQR